ncbi:uncharacterized protein [Panulirus ornatus]|uniref:uncharacterized protein n=1 Tax=Panulirus ornatus TaxID=150431 RepID=UPI003A87F589
MMRVAARVTCLMWALMLLLVLCFTPTMGRPSSGLLGQFANRSVRSAKRQQYPKNTADDVNVVSFVGGNPAGQPSTGAIIHKPSNRPPPPIRTGPRPRPRPRPWWQRG